MASSADIRMNQASVASDGSYVYAEAADGSLVKISKASLASLISLKLYSHSEQADTGKYLRQFSLVNFALLIALLLLYSLI